MIRVYEHCVRYVVVTVCTAVIGWAGSAAGAVLNPDADFSLQTVGNPLATPWNLSGGGGSHTVTADAQSPFQNAFASSVSKGAHVGTSAGNPYFVGGFTAVPAAAPGFLYLNVDFRNTDESADAYTLTVSKNAGVANTLMLAVSGGSLLARSGAGWGTSILDPVAGAWYNVQLTLNLNNDTYSGIVTQFGGPTYAISSRSFMSNADINNLFSDGGSDLSGGTAPGHDIDNFGLMTTAPDARIVNIDFNGVRDGDVVGPTYVGQGAAGGGTVFNGLLADSRSPNGDNLTVSGTNLLDSNGNATTIRFTVSPVGGDVGGTATTDPTSPLALLSDYVFDHSAANSSDSPFVISGLAGAQADLYFYLNSSAATVTVDGATASSFTPTGIYTTANTRYFARVPIVNGQITGHFGYLPNGTAVIQGLTIVASIPEPGTFVLLGFGGLGMLCWRRRRGR
jgi:hypothetical protein